MIKKKKTESSICSIKSRECRKSKHKKKNKDKGTKGSKPKTVKNVVDLNPTPATLILRVKSLNIPIKRQTVGMNFQKNPQKTQKNLIISHLQETHFKHKDTGRLRLKG